MPGDQCRDQLGRTAGAMVHRARVTVWRAGFGPAADELGPDEAAQVADTGKRLDDLERQVGALIELQGTTEQRLDLIADAARELSGAVSKLFTLVVGRPPAAELPEDVPQNVRMGEDRP
jgi:hypothetical protein